MARRNRFLQNRRYAQSINMYKVFTFLKTDENPIWCVYHNNFLKWYFSKTWNKNSRNLYFLKFLYQYLKAAFHICTIAEKIIGARKINQAKLDCSKKLLGLLLSDFLLLWLQFSFWKRDWALGSVFTHFWSFRNLKN